jgi:hypothetical protein
VTWKFLLISPQNLAELVKFTLKKNPELSQFLDEKYFWGKKNIAAHFLAQENMPK